MVNILSDRMSVALDGITEYSRRVTTIIGGRS
jgi:hypothetical protein